MDKKLYRKHKITCEEPHWIIERSHNKRDSPLRNSYGVMSGRNTSHSLSLRSYDTFHGGLSEKGISKSNFHGRVLFFFPL